MKKNKKFLLQQRGGMLVELMMTLAIAAIMIPFLFRYQQNTVERARNIAVTKQMEIVQNALEKYIVKNRASYVSAVGVNNWTVNLNQLNDFLPDGFSDPNGPGTNYGTYSLRVLKTQGLDNHAVLQGVVLLSNEDTPLRTREIVNLGGGKIGYIDGTNVRGGFNVFVRPKTDMGLTNVDSGLVGSTKTLRGNTEYLWRLPSGSESDATMQSPLNLDGHDIVNVNDASAMRAVFNAELNAGSILVRNMMYFLDGPTFNLNSFVFSSDDAVINGLLTSSNGSALNVDNTLSINGDLSPNIESTTFQSMGILDMNSINSLENLTVGTTDNPAVFTISTSTGQLGADMVDVQVGRVINIIDESDNFSGVTPRLVVKNKILPAQASNQHYWDATQQKIFLPNVALTNLPRALNFAWCYTHDCNNGGVLYPSDNKTGDVQFGLFSDTFLFEGGTKVTKNTPFVNVLNVNLCKIKKVIKIKINCLTSSKPWDDDENCKAVKAHNYDAYFTDCVVNGVKDKIDNSNPANKDDDGNNNPDDETEKEKIKEEEKNRQETGRGH